MGCYGRADREKARLATDGAPARHKRVERIELPRAVETAHAPRSLVARQVELTAKAAAETA